MFQPLKRIIQNQNGQVAIFVALIFQILFVFFAMVINVGLLVHHKINLQNSVDIAAYYGASKQAENLNAIAHMNYQIRQSWKLLAWRYRMLGSAGDFEVHPYNKITKTLNQLTAIESVDTNPSSNLSKFQEVPSFCITYIPFKEMPPGENTCKYLSSYSGIDLFKTPRVFGFLSISATMAATSNALRNAAIDRCKYFGSWNFIMLAKFIVSFNADQRDRILVINELSKTMSTTQDDFYDLDGESVKNGIKKTLEKNLTAPNRDAITKFEVYNSLSDPKCGSMTNTNRPVKWLSPIKIYPGFNYIDTLCTNNGASGGNIQPRGVELSADPASLPYHMNETNLVNFINDLVPFLGFRSNLTDTYNFSLGVEKNPWCMAYVGVSAETRPNIPFSPFGTITLKAQSFAKPFGGRIGPWYKSTWSRRELDDQYSDGATSVDPLIPPRVTDLSALDGTMQDIKNKKLRAANYSRYVGDPYGLKSAKMIGYYGRSIYELDPQWKTGPLVITATNNTVYNSSTSAPIYNDWDDLPANFNKTNGTGDILAWDHLANLPSKMRLLELSAVAPNTFDTAYYSIEPDFYHNYYLRMKNGFIAKVAPNVAANFRPDIGYHKGFRVGSFNLDEYNVKDQVATVYGGDEANVFPVQDQLPFQIEDWKHLLTGWGSANLSDYSMDKKNFGNCTFEPVGGVANPGNCVAGGSTGFSVKIISSDYLNSDLPLGGENISKGKILNPPPPNF